MSFGGGGRSHGKAYMSVVIIMITIHGRWKAYMNVVMNAGCIFSCVESVEGEGRKHG